MIANAETWTPSASDWQACQTAVGAVEADRIARFQRPTSDGTRVSGAANADARRSTLGRLMLQRLARTPLTRTALGKPVAVNGSVHVSAAHDAALVVAIVGRVACGVDVVAMRLPRASEAVDEFFDAFRDVFGADEWRLIRGAAGAPADQRAVDRFFVLWALKEAYVKATGDGIGFGLARLAFAFDAADGERLPSAAELAVDGVPMCHWLFRLRYAVAEAESGVRWIDDACTSAEPRDAPLYVVAHATTDADDAAALAFVTVRAADLV